MKRYNVLVEQSKRIWSGTKKKPFFERIDAIRRYLYPFYMKYFSENASLARMLVTDSGGNCEANSKLIIAVLVDAEVDFGPDWSLVVQLFADHIQPLIMEKNTGRLISLVTGAFEEVPGDVFSPAVLDYGIANMGGRAVDTERDSTVGCWPFRVLAIFAKFCGVSSSRSCAPSSIVTTSYSVAGGVTAIDLSSYTEKCVYALRMQGTDMSAIAQRMNGPSAK